MAWKFKAVVGFLLLAGIVGFWGLDERVRRDGFAGALDWADAASNGITDAAEWAQHKRSPTLLPFR